MWRQGGSEGPWIETKLFILWRRKTFSIDCMYVDYPKKENLVSQPKIAENYLDYLAMHG